MIGFVSNPSRRSSLRAACCAPLLSIFFAAGASAYAKTTRGPFVFDCQGAPATQLTATFLGKNAGRAKLVYKGETVIATQALAADGARYQAPHVDFWNKGDDATVEWRGKKLSCSIRK
jgi:membrane-bound inhibitor of C-type lysozyme